MGSPPSSPELNLSLKPSYVPKTIANLLKDLSNVGNASDKLVVLNDYINQHEEELNNIIAFKRQLPQCMLLLMEALGTLKDEYTNIKNGIQSENTDRHGRSTALMDQFLSIKRKRYEEKQTDIATIDQNHKYDNKGKSLMNHQLWNVNCENKKLQQPKFINLIQDLDQNAKIPFKDSYFRVSTTEKGSCSRKEIIRGFADNRFASIRRTYNNGNNITSGHHGLNLKAGIQILNNYQKPLTQPIWKNNRRVWSPELHARFVEALNLLGGIDVATPKQIREVLQVEGLTNDQVKSHLQKYRLHCKKLLPAKNHGKCLVKIQDPWQYPCIHYGKDHPLSSKEAPLNM